jgi:hypothetical protein
MALSMSNRWSLFEVFTTTFSIKAYMPPGLTALAPRVVGEGVVILKDIIFGPCNYVQQNG